VGGGGGGVEQGSSCVDGGRLREQVVSTAVWTVGGFGNTWRARRCRLGPWGRPGFGRDSSAYTDCPWSVVGWIPTPVRMMGLRLRNSGRPRAVANGNAKAARVARWRIMVNLVSQEDLVYLQGLAVDIVRRKCSKALARWAPTVCQVVSVMDRAKLKSSELATTTRNRSVFCYIHTPNHSHVFKDSLLSDLSRSRGFLLRRP
jgi:hypothetical protein